MDRVHEDHLDANGNREGGKMKASEWFWGCGAGFS
jgi:hypothetical protein